MVFLLASTDIAVQWMASQARGCTVLSQTRFGGRRTEQHQGLGGELLS